MSSTQELIEIHNTSMKVNTVIVKLLGVVNDVTKIVTECLGAAKVTVFA